MANNHVIRISRIDCHLDTTLIHLAYTLRQNQAKSGEVRQLFDVGHEQIVAGYNSINRVRNDTLRARARARGRKQNSRNLSRYYSMLIFAVLGVLFLPLRDIRKKIKRLNTFL